jgi:trimeric autotransporter adhesin
MTGVRSGAAVQYTDSSGAVTTSILMDADLQYMGGTLYKASGNTFAQFDNKIFDLQSQASLEVDGSSNVVILESGANRARLIGQGNSVVGSAVSGVYVGVSGANNVVSVGSNSNVYDGQDGLNATNSNITIGANSQCELAWDTGATVNATQGGCTIAVGGNYMFANSSSTINAQNDTIYMGGIWNNVSAQVNGDSNQINMTSGSTLSLSGKNNTISIDANNHNELITTANGDFVQEDASGAIWFSSASFSIHNGVVTLGFSDGNQVVFSNVRSSSDPGVGADSQLNQLVSAMASYSTDAGGASSVFMSHLPSDSSMLLASAHQ